MSDPNQSLRLKSLLFWKHKISKSDETSIARKFFELKDYDGYMAHVDGHCQFCNGSPVYHVVDNGKPVTLNGIVIERVQCYCMTLELLSSYGQRWYESRWFIKNVDDLQEIDIPAGAGKVTAVIKKNVKQIIEFPARWMFLTGKPGAGKTHLLHSVKTALGGFAVYISAEDFMSKLMKYVGEGKTDRYLKMLSMAPVLLIDDFGLQHKSRSEFELNALAQIINTRYLAGRLAPVLMTTNISLEDTIMAENQLVGNYERIFSRMKDSEISFVAGTRQGDYRDKIFKKGI